MTNWIKYLQIDDKYPENEERNKVLKFIFLWIKCNEYYNNKYCDICGDKNKFIELKENITMQCNYSQYSEEFLAKFEEFVPERRPNCYVIDMKHQNRKVYYHRFDKRRLEDLLKVIYQIRCNLFHGEKEPTSENIKFVCWAYDCLNILFKDII